MGSRKRPREQQGGEMIDRQEWQQQKNEKIMQVQAITNWEEDLCNFNFLNVTECSGIHFRPLLSFGKHFAEKNSTFFKFFETIFA